MSSAMDEPASAALFALGPAAGPRANSDVRRRSLLGSAMLGTRQSWEERSNACRR